MTRIARLGRKAVVMLAAGLAVASLVAPVSVSADNGAGAIVFEGTASLQYFPCNACPPGNFTGSAVGATTAGGVAPQVLSTMTASNFSYAEACAAGVGIPATGTANGYVTVGNQGEYFGWERVGLTAIIVLDDNPITTASAASATGGAVAVFVPTSVPNTGCGKGGISALVAGIGLWN